MYLGKLAESKKLLTCDVICHGAMSPLILDRFHEYLEKKTKKRIVEHIFRYKKAGWDHIECLKYDDGSIDYQTVHSQLYKQLFDVGLGIRPSCFRCKYASLNRVGDITLGDFWGINDVAPEYYSPSGVSMIMINTPKGMKVFDEVKNSGHFFETDVNSATLKQPHLKKPISRHKDDEIFWEYIIRDQFKKAVKLCGYNPDWAEFKQKIKRCLLMR
jgi:coenzyme F420-reducing hydrogenase beta subunit